MELTTFLLMAGLMAFVAAVYSNIGLGGGVLYVPILLWLTSFGKEEVVLLSLVLVVFTSLPSTWNHLKEGKGDMKRGITLESGSFIGAVFGVIFNLMISSTIFVLIFSLVLVLSGTKMLHNTLKGNNAETDRQELLTPRNIAIAAILSASTGFISASMGIGGGAINVIILTEILGFSTNKAAGTSSFKTVFTAMTGISIYLLSGIPLNLEMAILLAPVVFLSSYAGSKLGLRKLKSRDVRIIFIGGLFLAAAKMLLELLA